MQNGYKEWEFTLFSRVPFSKDPNSRDRGSDHGFRNQYPSATKQSSSTEELPPPMQCEALELHSVISYGRLVSLPWKMMWIQILSLRETNSIGQDR